MYIYTTNDTGPIQYGIYIYLCKQKKIHLKKIALNLVRCCWIDESETYN